MLFRLDIENSRKMMAKKLGENKLKNSMVDFSKLKHILIFSKLLWFANEDLDILTEVAK